MRRNLLNLCAMLMLGEQKIVVRLHVEPQFRRGAKIARKTQYGVGGDHALTSSNLLDLVALHPQDFHYRARGQAKARKKVVSQNFARTNGPRLRAPAHYLLVHKLNVERICTLHPKQMCHWALIRMLRCLCDPGRTSRWLDGAPENPRYLQSRVELGQPALCPRNDLAGPTLGRLPRPIGHASS